MTHRLLVWFLLLVLATAAACTKKDPDPAQTPNPPAAPTGELRGAVSPAGSIRTVRLGLVGSPIAEGAYPDAAGNFRFGPRPVGDYVLSFEAESGFVAPPPRTLAVAANAVTDAGTVAVRPNNARTDLPLQGTVTWTTNGNNNYATADVGGTIALVNGQPASFNLVATAPAGTTRFVVGLMVNLAAASTTGLYRLENATGNTGTYLVTNGGIPQGAYSTAGRGGLPGTVTVTAYDAAARTLSGTFGYTAYDPALPVCCNAVPVSNGSFSLRY